jgi:hypothetical protein
VTDTHGAEDDALDHGPTHQDAHAVLSDDDHGHAEAQLGPIDWPAWGYAVLGVAAGLLIVAFFVLANG